MQVAYSYSVVLERKGGLVFELLGSRAELSSILVVVAKDRSEQFELVTINLLGGVDQDRWSKVCQD